MGGVTMIKRKLIIGIILLTIMTLLLPACTGPATAETGTVQVHVTDALPKEVTAVEVKVSNIEAHRADAAEDQWVTLLANPPVFDLVKVSGVNQLLGTAEIAVGKYTQIRLDVIEVTVTLSDKQVKAIVPSDKLKIVGEFTVEEGKSTPISLDFDGEKSVIVTSQDNINVKPVVKLIVAKAGDMLENTATATTTATVNP